VRVVTDFDGVLTAQDGEAAAVGARLLERAAEALEDRVRALAIVEGLRAEVRANPTTHGWASDGRLGCYADEDPYVFNNALARAIYTIGPADLRDALRRAGFETDDALALACFEEGTARYRAAHPSHVLTDALGAIQTLFSIGAEVVIVSNSSNERIRSLLEPCGILRFGTGKLRIRGTARKHHITGDRPSGVPAEASFGGRTVHLRRGPYFEILADEQPDVVIGDVLSLDVALPAALRACVPDFEDMRVFLKRHPHTPRWALEACADRGIGVVDAFSELPRRLGV